MRKIALLFFALFLPSLAFAGDCLFSSQQEVNHVGSFAFNTVSMASPYVNIYFYSPVQDSSGCWVMRLAVELPQPDGSYATLYYDSGYNNMDANLESDLPLKDYIKSIYGFKDGSVSTEQKQQLYADHFLVGFAATFSLQMIALAIRFARMIINET